MGADEGIFAYPFPVPATAVLLLFLIAAASPLLTFSHLWQVKEWRWDRLHDHLKSEGALRQLFGVIRPPVVMISVLAAALLLLDAETAATGAIAALAGLAVLQFVLRRQPMPAWTTKAKMITGLSLIFLMLAGYAATLPWNPAAPLLLPLLVLLAPIFVMMAWAELRPLDSFLKRRILDRATRLREEHPEITVIGVTGSMGKTTTKELIACALGDTAAATPAYVNSEIGVARWLISNLDPKKLRSQEATTYVVEMGAYRRGEIALLCSIAQPQIGVITAIGTQHVALFGSQDDLLSAKGELVESLPENGHAFINIDSTLAAKLRAKARCPVTTVGTGGPSDCEAFEIEETPRGIRFRVGETSFSLPLHGTHNVTNVLLAIAVAEHCKIPRTVIAERLSRFSPLPGTFSVEEKHGVTILNDTHNCSPESAAAAIRWAESRQAQSKVLLTSGIIEQGNATEGVHRELGKQSVPVFPRVIFMNKKLAQLFALGYGKNVELFSKEIAPVESGTLLVCLGRMPRSAIERLLPQNV